jgi:hypothetical protein
VHRANAILLISILLLASPATARANCPASMSTANRLNCLNTALNAAASTITALQTSNSDLLSQVDALEVEVAAIGSDYLTSADLDGYATEAYVDALVCHGSCGTNAYSLVFDGFNDSVQVDDADLMSSPSGLTIEAWIYWSGTGDSYQRIAAHRDISDWWLAPFTLIIKNDDPTEPDALEFGFTDGTGTDSGWGVSSGPLAVPSSAWVHVAATYDASSNVARVYLNGEMVGEATAPYQPVSGTYPFWVGADPNTPDRDFRGNIDEVSVWSAPRTPEEIGYDMVISPSGTESGIALAWPMEEGTGQDVIDIAGPYDGRLGTRTRSDASDPAWTTNTAK